MTSSANSTTPILTALNSVRVQVQSACAKVKRDPSEVTLIAVSKTQPVARILEAVNAGQVDFGENYVQELVGKCRELGAQASQVRWHFIGHLQSNKVKTLLEDVPGLVAIHSIGSEKLLLEVIKRWAEVRRANPKRTLELYIEVNIDGEESKGGVTQAEGLGLSLKWNSIPAADREGLRLAGFMCIPEPHRDPRNQFFSLYSLADQAGLKGLSMGMSSDFSTAIEEGATHIRVGTLLFGARAPTQKKDIDSDSA